MNVNKNKDKAQSTQNELIEQQYLQPPIDKHIYTSPTINSFILSRSILNHADGGGDGVAEQAQS